MRAVLRAGAAAAIVAAAGAAVAMPTDGARPPRPILTGLTAPLAHSNSRDGRAVLTAADLKPGDRRSGEVTITNRGYAGALYLVASGARTPLADRLDLAIADVSALRPHVVASGPLATVARCHRLGSFPAGASRTFRFTVGFPRRDAGANDNRYAGATASIDLEWLETAAARDDCPDRAEDEVDLPAPAPPRPSGDGAAPEPRNGAQVTSGQVNVTIGDARLAIVPGPYRFAGRRGTAKVRIRCIEAPAGACRGRLELERWKGGQGKGIAMAVGRFAIPSGERRAVTLRLNPRARRRIVAKRAIAVRAYVTARDARGKTHRVAYRDRLVYRPAGRRR